jgi:hypothetical protein
MEDSPCTPEPTVATNTSNTNTTSKKAYNIISDLDNDDFLGMDTNIDKELEILFKQIYNATICEI